MKSFVLELLMVKELKVDSRKLKVRPHTPVFLQRVRMPLILGELRGAPVFGRVQRVGNLLIAGKLRLAPVFGRA